VSSADLSGLAVFRVIQCESPCRGVGSKIGSRVQSSLFRRDGQRPRPAFQSSVIANWQSGGILIGRLQPKVAKTSLLKNHWPHAF
jgi:hypothetical protein